MLPLRHFYHCAVSYPRWRPIAAGHVDALEAASLVLPVTVGLVGRPEDRAAAREWFGKNLATVDSFVEQDAGWEHATLSAAREWAQQNQPGAVLYMHTKGCYSVLEQNDWWRECMTRDLVGRWQECVGILSHFAYDAVGTHWLSRENGLLAPGEEIPFFGGNFWWASSSYLATLPEPGPVEDRFTAERWIGRGWPMVRDLNPGHPGAHCRRPLQWAAN